MKLSDFDFDLPKKLIAQSPTEQRDHSNLLLTSPSGKYDIVKFHQIIDLLKEGDLLVFNDSKVIKAKFNLYKENKAININLNKPISKDGLTWLAFAKPAKKLKQGDIFNIDQHKIIIEEKKEFGEIVLKFILNNQTNIFSFLDQYGKMPLPQYIKRNENENATQDEVRYQNVYSKHEGSVAAPTAGLHFTNQLIENLEKKGIDKCFVTLHVGAGTFLPVKVDNIKDHVMHSEWCHIDESTAKKINKAKKENRRVIVVGTTAMRTVESLSENNLVYPGVKDTNIFITPGYKFQIADSLITNFHLPKSTLFMLVCAFSGYEEMKNLYQHAISKKMRFFSYGDAMLINKK